MEAICKGEKIIDIDLLWGNTTLPVFTYCFQNTVLIWAPSAVLWVTLPIYLPYLLNLPSELQQGSWKWRGAALRTLTVLQLLLCAAKFLTSPPVAEAGYAKPLAPLIEIGTLLLSLVLLRLEKAKGFVTSGIHSVYWFFVCVACSASYFARAVKQDAGNDTDGDLAFQAYFLLSFVQFVLHSIVEKVPDIPGRKQNPYHRSSFLARITFCWLDGLISLGYKRPLTEDDLYELHPTIQSQTVVPEFEKYWEQEKLKLPSKQQQQQSKTCESSIKKDMVNDDKKSQKDATIGKPDNEKKESEEEDNKPGVSVVKVLLKTFWVDYIICILWNFFILFLNFCNPVLLRLLIGVCENPDTPSWKGYVIATGLLVVKFTMVFSNRHLHGIFNVNLNLRVRSALTAVVYKKSLSMNNAARTESTVGEMVNLMSVDAEHIRHALSMMWGFFMCPSATILSLVFLYYEVGYAMLAGLGVLLVITPINVLLVRWCRSASKQGMAEKDKRMKLMNEILNGIKVLKLYAWEMAFGDKVLEIRNKEAEFTKKDRTAGMLMHFSWTLAPFAIGVATFSTYIFMSEDHRLDAQTAFVAISLFDILRGNLNWLPWLVTDLIKASVSVKRLNKFLNQDDINTENVKNEPSDDAISVSDGTFRWDEKTGATLQDINLSVPKGSLVAVVGQVGCGKSSLVSAMLGEMEKVSGTVNVDGSIAYVPQQAWIQNATLRSNILFGKPRAKTRYQNVIEACSLKTDLDMLTDGDATLIGEKGVNLSGGQKQRVSLARAVYFDADIYLLDDPLSAVDSHVGKHIFQQVIGNKGLLKDKTRVLVTHGIKWLPYVDTIFAMSNGKIAEMGSYQQLMDHNGAFAQFMKTYLTEHSQDSDSDDEVVELKSKTLERLDSFKSDGNLKKEIEALKNTSINKDPSGLRLRRSVSHYFDNRIGRHGIKRAMSHSEVESKPVNGIVPHQLERSMSSAEKAEENRTDRQIFKRMISVVETETGDDYDDDKAAANLEEEEIETGSVDKSVVFTYLRAVGYKFVVLILVLLALDHVSHKAASLWLVSWTSDRDLHNMTALPADSDGRYSKNLFYLIVYGVLGFLPAFINLLSSRTRLVCSLNAGSKIHNNLLVNVLRGPTSFFDTTPTGRIVTRFSKDINHIDFSLPDQLGNFCMCIQNAVITVFMIVNATPGIAYMIVPLGIIYYTLQRVFTPTHRQINRIESKSRSPIFSHFSETLSGVSLIRAFKLQKRFEDESERRLDKYQEVLFLQGTVNTWLGIRMQLMNGINVWLTGIFAVMGRTPFSGALVGLSISHALQITHLLEWMMHMISNLESDMVSLEKVSEYTKNPVEAPVKTSVAPRPEWPEAGKVEFDSYSVRYREGLDCVLKRITISIRAGEKVGIVGRTGAGKSTLTSSIFRLLEPASGTIKIDGEDIVRFGLHDLRSRLTILPQEPVLFAGSLRMNLDPLDRHTDSQLWQALRHAHLREFVEKLPDKLMYECGEGGQNLSVGQRQLICLARSLLKKTKILVLDEATAAVDMATDELIQKTINTEFRECTVLTIAHRLNTVLDYDKILVLSQGKVQEFDSPKNLLSNKNSEFYGMAKDSGLV